MKYSKLSFHSYFTASYYYLALEIIYIDCVYIAHLFPICIQLHQLSSLLCQGWSI